ncbi:twin-arginine translocase subunit TatC [Hippea maritima]|uniref:Sec-independent protein translocase protein TatC n=1 Tax=Hippea maritima (strain ATCC 700847 / DSM 10411 / MH2) TaxID=760142 RepID=F2LUZ5_HIPMA|nr:twin-arginine translocase subunit TatC [Hippea maritima]AEA33579.1 Sec-independent protein translocase, TatC subunit [Hippea maritima DSM 10411]
MKKRIKKDPNNMTLLEHIEELRIRLLWIVGGILVALVGMFSYSQKVIEIAVKPLKDALPAGSKIIFTGVTEAFWVRVEAALVAAIIVSIPFTFYQIWLFIKPGLKENERKFAIPFVFVFSVLFVGGAMFAYWVVLPLGFKFLLKYGGKDLSAMPSIKQYMSLFLKMITSFGLVFELPIISFILARMGVINGKDLLKKFDYALLVIFFVAAILTPPDVFTQFLMAAPLTLLYILSIIIAYVFSTKDNT